jgi:hypothetical protein
MVYQALRELIQQAMHKNGIGPQLIALELAEGSLFETRRHRLLVAVLSQALARGLTEDRPQLRA